MTELTLDQFWRCPQCSAMVAMGSPGLLHPSKCGAGHKPVEMEQTTAEAFAGDGP